MKAAVVKTAPNVLSVQKLCISEFQTGEIFFQKTET